MILTLDNRQAAWLLDLVASKLEDLEVHSLEEDPPDPDEVAWLEGLQRDLELDIIA